MVQRKKSEDATIDILKAIIIADSFNNRFKPITYDEPRALLPLCNVPLLEHTIEFLTAGGVEEIYICYRSHGDKIKDYLENCKWTSEFSSCNIVLHNSSTATDVGDILRDLANSHSQSFTNDFILVTSDIVSNVNLQAALRAHKDRIQLDKFHSYAATLLLKQATPDHYLHSQEEDVVAAIDNEGCMVEFIPSSRFDMAKDGKSDDSLKLDRIMVPTPLNISCQLFNNKDRQISIRADLVNCHIAICTPLVLELFVDNFDYDTIPNFIRGVLDDDIRRDKIYTYVIKDEYAAKVSNLKLYKSVTKDVLQRWVFPYVPEANFNESCSDRFYTYRRGNIYVNKTAQLARTCNLQNSSMIGANTTISENCLIEKSVIGDDCVIGENVTIKNSYIWNNVKIGDNCNLDGVIVCHNVVLSNNVTALPGSMVGTGVSISSEKTVDKNHKLTKYQVEGKIVDTQLQMEENEAYLWEPDSDDSCLQFEEEFSIDVSSDEFSIDDDDDDFFAGPNPEEVFFTEVSESLQNAHMLGCRNNNSTIDADNVVLEINASKHAYNISVPVVMETVILCILKDKIDLGANARVKYLNELFTALAEVVKRYVSQTGSDQLSTLYVIEEHCRDNASDGDILKFILQITYDLDIIDEVVILKWYYADKYNDSVSTDLRKGCAQFVTWLEEASEEESESE